MQTVNISDFRSNLLKYLELANSGEPISVTSNGRLLATVNPPVNRRELAREQLNVLATKVKLGDVVSPTGSEWDVLK